MFKKVPSEILNGISWGAIEVFKIYVAVKLLNRVPGGKKLVWSRQGSAVKTPSTTRGKTTLTYYDNV